MGGKIKLKRLESNEVLYNKRKLEKRIKMVQREVKYKSNTEFLLSSDENWQL
jgi:hypothetical protein